MTCCKYYQLHSFLYNDRLVRLPVDLGLELRGRSGQSHASPRRGGMKIGKGNATRVAEGDAVGTRDRRASGRWVGDCGFAGKHCRTRHLPDDAVCTAVGGPMDPECFLPFWDSFDAWRSRGAVAMEVADGGRRWQAVAGGGRQPPLTGAGPAAGSPQSART